MVAPTGGRISFEIKIKTYQVCKYVYTYYIYLQALFVSGFELLFCRWHTSS